MTSRTFHLEWSQHLPNMQALLETFYSHQSLVDVTLCCRDGTLKAHRVILSACSPYFESIFRENPCKHPVLILKGMSVHEMEALLTFMYKGSVDIAEADLSSLVSTASEFKVKGFAFGGSGESGESSEAERPHREPKPTNEADRSDQNYDDGEDEPELENLHEEHIAQVKTEVESPASNSNENYDSDLQDENDVASPRIVSSESLRESEVEHRNDENAKPKEVDEMSEDKSTPYPRETRFKGQKRVAVGIRIRSKSSERRESESRISNVDRRDEDILEATGLVKKLKTTPTNETTKNVLETFYKSLSEHSDDGRMKYVPDIVIKEEHDDSSSMFCITSMQGTYNQESYSNEDSSNKISERSGEGGGGGGDTVCPYCLTDCQSVAELKKHIICHSAGDRPHQCEFCDLAFARASHLARHRRTHTGERPFTCPDCGRQFSRQDKLKQHIKRHHLEIPRFLAHPLADQHPALQQVPVLKRGRGRPRKNSQPPHTGPASHPYSVQSRGPSSSGGSREGQEPAMNSMIGESERTNFATLPSSDSSNVALPFGDTSYLSSLSLGQQRYNDLAINPVPEPGGLASSGGPPAEDLLKSVRQLGECTIQAVTDN